jgi:hypothetical protein
MKLKPGKRQRLHNARKNERGKRIQEVCDQKLDVVLARSERFPLEINRKLPEG